MVVKHTIAGTEAPARCCRCQSSATHHIAQQATVACPARGGGRTCKLLVDTVEVGGCAVVDIVAVGILSKDRPVHNSLVCIRRDTVVGDDRCRACQSCGEINSACPCAHTVDATTVGAHLDGVPGSGSKPCEGVGVVAHSLDDCEVCIASLIGHIPCSLAATGRPAQLHLVGIGGTGSESRGSWAGNTSGEAHHTRPLASTVGTAVALHLGLISGLGGKAFEGHRIGSGRSTLPIASRNLVTNHNVVNIEIELIVRRIFDANVFRPCGDDCTIEMPLLVRYGYLIAEGEVCLNIACCCGGSGACTHLECFWV